MYLKPRTELDKEYVGLDNQIEGRPSILKIRMFVERKLFEKAKLTGKIHRNIIKNNMDNGGPKVNIKLFIGKREVKDEDSV